MPAGEEEENAELMDFRRRFWISLPLTAMVFVLAMAGYRLIPLNPAWKNWLELVLATPAVLWAGLPFFERCVQSFCTAARTCGRLSGWGRARPISIA